MLSLTDNAVDTLPVGDYSSSGRLHTNDLGTAALSERIADQLSAILNTPSSHAGATHRSSLTTNH